MIPRKIHAEPTDVIHYGDLKRVTLRLYPKDTATVTVKSGGANGLASLARATQRRLFTGSHSDARSIAEILGPIIDGYAEGCGIKPCAVTGGSNGG